MLKFLTHKLRTHSLNEDQPDHFKADDDHDSGTESDDEHGDRPTEYPESIMESETDRSSGSTVSPDPFLDSLSASSPSSLYYPDSALPSDSDHNCDHHSSEEELEVINSKSHCAARSNKNIQDLLHACRTGHVTVPEKRKWSQVIGGTTNTNCNRVLTTMISRAGGTVDGEGGTTTTTTATAAVVGIHADQSSGSSDEEVQGLLAAMATPVQFRSSPPYNAHKPGHHSLSPPPKLFHYGGRSSSAALEVSPRKRHRHTPRAHHVQRPCLDFEKMQQLKARAVTAWRHSGDHGGELSVFCW